MEDIINSLAQGWDPINISKVTQDTEDIANLIATPRDWSYQQKMIQPNYDNSIGQLLFSGSKKDNIQELLNSNNEEDIMKGEHLKFAEMQKKEMVRYGWGDQVLKTNPLMKRMLEDGKYYDPSNSQENNEGRAGDEDKWRWWLRPIQVTGKFVSRLAPLVVTKVGGLGANIGAAAYAAFDNEAPDIMTSIADNALIKGIAKAEESLKEDWMHVYKSVNYDNKGFFSKFATEDFWMNDATDFAAFQIASLLTGRVFGGLGLSGGVAKGALGNIFQTEAKGIAGTLLETLTGAKNIGGITAWGVNTGHEALTEASGAWKDTGDQLRGTYNPETQQTYTEAEIRKKQSEAAAFVFKGNLAVLAFSNGLENRWAQRMLGKTERGLLLNKTTGLAEKISENKLLRKIFSDKVIDRITKNPIGVRALSYGPELAETLLKEGYWEENAQNVLTRLASGKYGKGTYERIGDDGRTEEKLPDTGNVFINFFSQLAKQTYDASVIGESVVLIKKDNIIERVSIEDLFNRYSNYRTTNTELRVNTPLYKTLTVDEDNKIIWKELKSVIQHKVQKKLIKLYIEGGKTVTVTSDHSMISMDKEGNLFEITAENFDENSFVLVNSKTLFNESNINKYYSYNVPKTKGKIKYGDFEILIDKTLLEFLGLWVGDGHYTKQGVAISSYIDIECQEVINEIAKRFNCKVTVTKDGITGIVNNITLQDFMKQVGFIGKCNTKRIPTFILNLNEDDTCSFLRGYFSADGCGNNLSCFSVSKDLINDVSYLLNGMKIRNTISIIKARKCKLYSYSKGYTLSIRDTKSNILFNNNIRFLQKYKNNKIVEFINSNLTKNQIGSKQEGLPVNLSLTERINFTRESVSILKVKGKRIKRNDINIKNFSKKVFESELLFVYVKKVEYIIPKEDILVYDLEVPGVEKFFANDILVHNSTWIGGKGDFEVSTAIGASGIIGMASSIASNKIALDRNREGDRFRFFKSERKEKEIAILAGIDEINSARENIMSFSNVIKNGYKKKDIEDRENNIKGKVDTLEASLGAKAEAIKTISDKMDLADEITDPVVQNQLRKSAFVQYVTAHLNNNTFDQFIEQFSQDKSEEELAMYGFSKDTIADKNEYIQLANDSQNLFKRVQNITVPIPEGLSKYEYKKYLSLYKSHLFDLESKSLINKDVINHYNTILKAKYEDVFDHFQNYQLLHNQLEDLNSQKDADGSLETQKQIITSHLEDINNNLESSIDKVATKKGDQIKTELSDDVQSWQNAVAFNENLQKELRKVTDLKTGFKYFTESLNNSIAEVISETDAEILVDDNITQADLLKSLDDEINLSQNHEKARNSELYKNDKEFARQVDEKYKSVSDAIAAKIVEEQKIKATAEAIKKAEEALKAAITEEEKRKAQEELDRLEKEKTDEIKRKQEELKKQEEEEKTRKLEEERLKKEEEIKKAEQEKEDVNNKLNSFKKLDDLVNYFNSLKEEFKTFFNGQFEKLKKEIIKKTALDESDDVSDENLPELPVIMDNKNPVVDTMMKTVMRITDKKDDDNNIQNLIQGENKEYKKFIASFISEKLEALLATGQYEFFIELDPRKDAKGNIEVFDDISQSKIVVPAGVVITVRKNGELLKIGDYDELNNFSSIGNGNIIFQMEGDLLDAKGKIKSQYQNKITLRNKTQKDSETFFINEATLITNAKTLAKSGQQVPITIDFVSSGYDAFGQVFPISTLGNIEDIFLDPKDKIIKAKTENGIVPVRTKKIKDLPIKGEIQKIIETKYPSRTEANKAIEYIANFIFENDEKQLIALDMEQSGEFQIYMIDETGKNDDGYDILDQYLNISKKALTEGLKDINGNIISPEMYSEKVSKLVYTNHKIIKDENKQYNGPVNSYFTYSINGTINPTGINKEEKTEDDAANSVSEVIDKVKIKDHIDKLSKDNYLFTHVTTEDNARSITDGGMSISVGTGISSTLTLLGKDGVNSQIERLQKGEVVHRDLNNNSVAVISVPKSELDAMQGKDISEKFEDWLAENNKLNSKGQYAIPTEFNAGYLSKDGFISKSKPKKEGVVPIPVSEVYKNNSKLSEIGDEKEYSDYVKSIFPDSQLKDVVYHRSNVQFENFDFNKVNKDTGGSFDFSTERSATQYGKYIHAVILNIKDWKQSYNRNSKTDGTDYSYLAKNNEGGIYGVYEAEQIHILGSKADIQGFKKWKSESLLATPVNKEDAVATEVLTEKERQIINDNSLELSKDGKTYVNKEGENFERQSNYVARVLNNEKTPSDSLTNSLIGGDFADIVARDIFVGKIKTLEEYKKEAEAKSKEGYKFNITPELFDSLVKSINSYKDGFPKETVFFTNNITVSKRFKKAEGNLVGVAGVIDILARTKDGKFHIIDTKTKSLNPAYASEFSNNIFEGDQFEAAVISWENQQSVYKTLFNIDVESVNIMVLPYTYSTKDKVVTVSKIHDGSVVIIPSEYKSAINKKIIQLSLNKSLIDRVKEDTVDENAPIKNLFESVKNKLSLLKTNNQLTEEKIKEIENSLDDMVEQKKLTEDQKIQVEKMLELEKVAIKKGNKVRVIRDVFTGIPVKGEVLIPTDTGNPIKEFASNGRMYLFNTKTGQFTFKERPTGVLSPKIDDVENFYQYTSTNNQFGIVQKFILPTTIGDYTVYVLPTNKQDLAERIYDEKGKKSWDIIEDLVNNSKDILIPESKEVIEQIKKANCP